MDTMRKLRKEISKMNDAQIENALGQAIGQQASYNDLIKGQESIHKALIKNRMIVVKKNDKEGEDVIAHQLEIVEKELERLRKIDRELTEKISILQKSIHERAEGSVVKGNAVKGWLAVGTTAIFSGLGLWLGYKSDNSGTMKNKSPLQVFDKCLGWLKGIK